MAVRCVSVTSPPHRMVFHNSGLLISSDGAALPFIEQTCENTGMSFDSYGGAVEPPESDGESRRPGGAPSLAAGVEELVVDGIDVIQAKAALARLGERGSADLEALDAQRTIALLTELRKLSGAVAAIEARALVRLESAVADDSLERGETPRQAHRVARAEAAAALKKSTSAAGQSMSSCRRLVRSMPRVLRALAQGRAMPAAASPCVADGTAWRP